MPTPDDVLNALRGVQEPELHKDLVTLNMVRDVRVTGGAVRFDLVLTTPACPLKDKIRADIEAALRALPGVETIDIDWKADVRRNEHLAQTQGLPAGIKNIVAVASGKGGVGKSTTAVNLAVALKLAGAKVGILDSDIYGPNVPMMMGIPENQRPDLTPQQHMIPLEGHGIKVMSIGFLVDPGKAIIWRGPMLNNIIRQFLMNVEWGALDYLIVDLPPGTGDAPLSLAQSVPLSGAVVVTTPQEIALSDVRRSIAMFNEMRVPVLGLIENMSSLSCPHCHQSVPLFIGEGGERLSKEFDVPLLGKIPFDPAVAQAGDHGRPITISQPGSVQAKAFVQAAEWVAARVSVQNAAAGKPLIQIS